MRLGTIVVLTAILFGLLLGLHRGLAQSGPNGGISGPNGGISGPNGSISGPQGGIAGPNGGIAGPGASQGGGGGSCLTGGLDFSQAGCNIMWMGG